MKFRGVTILAGLMALALTGCGTQYEKAQMMKPSGDAFTSSLHYYYTQIAGDEFREGDYGDADHFGAKAIASAAGGNVLADEMSSRNLPAETVGELAEARRLLTEALDGGGRQALPDSAAKAQVMWDCWFQEQEENFQPDDIARCRDQFWAALNAVQQAIATEPEPEPEKVMIPAPEPAEFLVYFDFDDSGVRTDQAPVMSVIIEAAKAAPDRAIHIVGHTDTSGALDYNQALSERRTNTVIGELISAGVSRGRISSEAAGETKPLVNTEDGVVEQGNRVATVTLF